VSYLTLHCCDRNSKVCAWGDARNGYYFWKTSVLVSVATSDKFIQSLETSVICFVEGWKWRSWWEIGRWGCCVRIWKPERMQGLSGIVITPWYPRGEETHLIIFIRPVTRSEPTTQSAQSTPCFGYHYACGTDKLTE